MRTVLAVGLGGLLLVGCGGGGGGLAAGNSAPSLIGVLDPVAPPTTASPLQLTPDIGDESPGSCRVTWTLKVWDGTFTGQEPTLIDAVPGTHIQTGTSATPTTNGESAVTFNIIQSGWYTVDVIVKDSDGAATSVERLDYTVWCAANGFGQCSLLPVGDASDLNAPIIDLAQVLLKGAVNDVGDPTGSITLMEMTVGAGAPQTVTLSAAGTDSSDFTTPAIDCPGVAVQGTDVVTTVTLTCTEGDSNVSNKQVTITEHVPVP